MRTWSSFDAMLRYYLAEGFVLVESRCRGCLTERRGFSFPGAREMRCAECGGQAEVTRQIEPHVES